MTILQIISLECPQYYISLSLSRRDSLWKGQELANGGNCLMPCERVQCPLEFGGLGIHNLELVGYALHTRWVWAQKTYPLQPWARLSV